jgi:anti-anti-sigma regulatory factor
MLKIVQSGTAVEQRWTLCGQLAGPWVAELRSNWERARKERDGRRRVVDLRDVTFIDESGEGLLHQMRDQGAEFVASGVDTKDVIENLASAEKRPLRKFVAHLGSGCEEGGRADLKEESK